MAENRQPTSAHMVRRSPSAKRQIASNRGFFPRAMHRPEMLMLRWAQRWWSAMGGGDHPEAGGCSSNWVKAELFLCQSQREYPPESVAIPSIYRDFRASPSDSGSVSRTAQTGITETALGRRQQANRHRDGCRAAQRVRERRSFEEPWPTVRPIECAACAPNSGGSRGSQGWTLAQFGVRRL